MDKKKFTCCVCSCFCEDIEVEIENDKIANVENACLKGYSFIIKSRDQEQRASCIIDGYGVKVEQAVDEAAKLLSRSNNPMIFGLDHCTVEAQIAAIELARRLKGGIDDYSSFGHGKLTEHILKGNIPSCSLPDIKKAEFIIYWGSNPQHSHPRHLSEFSYYSHPGYSEVSTVRNIEMCVVDVRGSETAGVSNPFVKLLPGGDRNFIASVIQGLDQRLTKEVEQLFFDMLYKSSFSVIFAGSGLVYSLKNDFSQFIEMINKFDVNINVIPMTDQPNMRGFNQSLFEDTGFVNRVRFDEGISSGSDNSFWEQVRNNNVDCILIIGADPFHSMPLPVIERLKKIPLITIDPFITATTEASKIVFGPAISGIETGGRVIRMDGTEVPLVAIEDSDKISDEQIIKLLLDKVDK